ncbi:MAG: VCBS repeat-containing protein [Bacteroidota bacterium]
MWSKSHLALYMVGICSFCSCGKSSENTALFELKEATGINFVNTVQDTKDFNILTYRNFYNGGGVAIGDIDNDGLADVFFTANMGSNKLYKNKGNLQFDDISAKAGFVEKQDWSTGVVMVDINNDGWLDIYVCNAGYVNGNAPESKLFINNGASLARSGNKTGEITFTESAKEYGLDNKGGYATHAAFFDYDLDGDLDVFIINNSFIPVNTLNHANKRDLRARDWPVADFLKGGGDRFYKNDNGKFVEVGQEAGIHGSLISFGLGVTVGDVNGDNYPDVYVSNDFFERDYLYINQKNGTFKDDLENWMGHTSLASMGADIGDINNDGYPDIFTTDMLPDDDYRLKTTSSFDIPDLYRYKVKQGFYNQFMQNTLQVNNGNGKFAEAGFYSGVAASDWSWGALMFDADNDGLTDIYVCNGIYHDVTDHNFIDFFANDIIQNMVLTGKKEQVDDIIAKMPSVPILNKAFKNQGDLKFSDAGASWGFTKPSFSNGAAYGDLDNDGDLDLVISNVNEKAFIYQNTSREKNKNNYIGISVTGTGSNTFAIGSKIKVYAAGKMYSREIEPSRGFQSSSDYKQIIGLDTVKIVDSVTVTWPGGLLSKYGRLEINKVHKLQQPTGSGRVDTMSDLSTSTFLQSLVTNMDKHSEDDYLDFYDQRNLPKILSREGPKIGKGDVNGDGLEDVYIGGAKGQAGQLYLQSTTGFTKKQQAVFAQFADFEDVAVLFFDADKDGDLDLFIGAGGNDVPAGGRLIKHRLYKNEGKGNFSLAEESFPSNNMNISVAANYDYDGDGDEDLFVGARSVPFSFGSTPQSYLLKNDGQGHFTDVAPILNADIANAGMITGAAWADVNGDGQKELVVTGEWMPTRIFSYKKGTGKFEELKQTNLQNLVGWWQTIVAADVNGDNKTDLIIGNIGENFYLRPDENHPVKMWVNDFDNNGSADQFLTRTVEGKDVPVFLRKEITDQFPALKKQNLKPGDYAKKTIQDLFSPDLIAKSLVKEFVYSSSIVAINDGKGHFTIQKLPTMVQLSSVNAITTTDLNGDSKPDLILGGNLFGFTPQFGRLDASCGDVLLNNGKGEFARVNPKKSGISLRGEIKDIKEIAGKNVRYILVVQNDLSPSLYQVNGKSN